MSLFDVVLWDMDGTIVDTEDVGLRAVRASWREHFDEDPTNAELWFGRSEREFFAAILKAAGHDLPVADLQASYHRHYLPLLAAVEPLPGVHDCWRRFKASGHAQAIVSGSARSQIELVARKLGWHEHLHTIVSCEDYARGKPDPEPFVLAIERMNADPARVLVLEDSDVGVASARAAGVRVIGVRCGNPAGRYHLRDAHAVVETLSDLTTEVITAVFAE